MKMLVAYYDRTGAGLKAARDTASFLETALVPIEAESRLVKMSWMGMLEDFARQPWKTTDCDLLIVIIEASGKGLIKEIGELLSRTRTLSSGYALAVVTTGKPFDTSALIEKAESAAGRKPLAFIEASSSELNVNDGQGLWRTKMERFCSALPAY